MKPAYFFETSHFLENGETTDSRPPAIFCMFYALSALGHASDFSTSKHGQLIGWFNKNFIKDRVFERKYGKMLREAFEIRNRVTMMRLLNFPGRMS